MHDEFRESIHRAAPRAGDHLDVEAMWRRGHGLRRVKVALTLALLLVLGGGLWISVRAGVIAELFETSPTNPAAPAPTSLSVPSDAIVFERASSDSLDARIELSFVPAAGGRVVPITNASKRGLTAAEPRWSPDGSEIAFVMGLRGHLTRYAGDGDIYVMNADGTDIHQVRTRGPGSAEPTWSPDGSRIAFVKNQGHALVVMDSDGSHQHVIARRRGYYQLPAWSPDGRTIAYQSRPRGKGGDATAIFVIRPSGRGERELTDGSTSEGFPAWSPSGSQIAYSAGGRIWIMRARGGGARQVTHCGGSCVADFAPAWSPDARRLVFVRQEDGGAARRLYVVDLATGNVKPLAPQVRWAESPSWRP